MHLSKNFTGKVIKSIFMDPYGISQKQLAVDLGLSKQKISDLLQGRKKINLTIAEKLAETFHVPSSFWLQLQSTADLTQELPKTEQI